MTSQPRIEDAVVDPSRRYRSPFDVLRDTALDRDQKRRILESWKVDAGLLSTATYENMTGGESALPLLRDVHLALEQLDAAQS